MEVNCRWVVRSVLPLWQLQDAAAEEILVCSLIGWAVEGSPWAAVEVRLDSGGLAYGTHPQLLRNVHGTPPRQP